MRTAAQAGRWTVVVPIKPFGRAKTRLALRPECRAAAANAFADHVLAVLRQTPAIETVVVVGVGHPIADVRLPDPGSLNAAVGAGRRWAARHRAHQPIAVLPADLPALTADLLGAALAAAGGHSRAFVPDRRGDGTTLVTADSPARLVAAYGPGSARRHAGMGLQRLAGDWPGVRDDVDTVADMDALAVPPAGGGLPIGRPAARRASNIV